MKENPVSINSIWMVYWMYIESFSFWSTWSVEEIKVISFFLFLSLQAAGRTLKFESVISVDEGKYTCIAVGPNGCSAKADVWLTYERKDIPQGENTPPHPYPLPTPQLSWFWNEVYLKLNQRIFVIVSWRINKLFWKYYLLNMFKFFYSFLMCLKEQGCLS